MNNQVRIAINLSSRIPSIHTCSPARCLLISHRFFYICSVLILFFLLSPKCGEVSLYTHRVYLVLFNYFFEKFSLCKGNLRPDIELYSTYPHHSVDTFSKLLDFSEEWTIPANSGRKEITRSIISGLPWAVVVGPTWNWWGAAQSGVLFLRAHCWGQDGCDSDCSILSWDPASPSRVWLWKWSRLHIHLCSLVCRRPERVTQLGNWGQESPSGQEPSWGNWIFSVEVSLGYKRFV